MPSAANVKIDKQINPENALAESSQNLTSLRQAITIIEHKIRNLEKRKAKLESYKELQNAGKELNSDQKTAVAKFSEVINTLDFARDLCKQFVGIATVSEKEAKKNAKKEAAAKYQGDLARLREILLVQDALNQMGNETVREDFLNGRNGAAQLTESDLKLLDDLYPAVTPKHEAGNPVAFTNEVQAAAEHLLAVVDGKQKEVFGGTYSQIKEILGKIHESGYFDQAQVSVFENYESEYVEPEVPVIENPVVEPDTTALPPQSDPPVNSIQESIPIIESLTIESRTFQQQPPVVPPVEQQPVIPEPPQVEQALPPYYQQVPPPSQQVPPPVQQQQQQPPRPITEMLGSGSFFFLQESEIDPAPDQIPSQTFTNQNFSTHPPPPHPVPIPPPHFTSIPNNLPPPPTNHQPQIGNNGVDENRNQPEEQKGAPGLRGTNVQPFYPSNYNGNNRPRQQQQQQHPPVRNGSGPRPATNRH